MIGQRSELTSITHRSNFFVVNTLFWCVVVKKRYVRMGIIIFKTYICGGISSFIRSESVFYGDALVPSVYPTIYLPK